MPVAEFPERQFPPPWRAEIGIRLFRGGARPASDGEAAHARRSLKCGGLTQDYQVATGELTATIQ